MTTKYSTQQIADSQASALEACLKAYNEVATNKGWATIDFQYKAQTGPNNKVYVTGKLVVNNLKDDKE